MDAGCGPGTLPPGALFAHFATDSGHGGAVAFPEIRDQRSEIKEQGLGIREQPAAPSWGEGVSRFRKNSQERQQASGHDFKACPEPVEGCRKSLSINTRFSPCGVLSVKFTMAPVSFRRCKTRTLNLIPVPQGTIVPRFPGPFFGRGLRQDSDPG
jgi:hypothetical protein